LVLSSINCIILIAIIVDHGCVNATTFGGSSLVFEGYHNRRLVITIVIRDSIIRRVCLGWNEAFGAFACCRSYWGLGNSYFRTGFDDLNVPATILYVE
jgi:hypothetical protein